MSFQVQALPPGQFEPLFAMSDIELEKVRACRVIANAKPGYPCRVSLADAEIGETLILLNFEHQPGDSPFQSTHAIYVRENAEQASPAVGEIPEDVKIRLTSIRAFDDKHHIVDADVIDGSLLSESIPAMLENPEVSYLHLHNAKLGCFTARVTRT
ncbi:MAG: DUF1203 domain-containing protein [Gammaproteobacteria bacterium]|nr:DUF1203 domain-containing protein [Gammaproteobacteria bacterium]